LINKNNYLQKKQKVEKEE